MKIYFTQKYNKRIPSHVLFQKNQKLNKIMILMTKNDL